MIVAVSDGSEQASVPLGAVSSEVGQGPLLSMLRGLALAGGLFLGACAGSGGERHVAPTDAAKDAEIGRTAHPRIVEAYGGVYDEGGTANYVERIVERLDAGIQAGAGARRPYIATVLDSPIVNAFALPGGYVYVTRGLVALANDEAELAGVIAHEIGHVNARHIAARRAAATGTSILGGLLGTVLGSGVANKVVAFGAESLLAGYSREQESEADRLAVSYLVRAGYDPYAVRDFLNSINAQAAFQSKLIGADYNPSQAGWRSSHPATADRIGDTAHQAALALQSLSRSPSSFERARAHYLSVVDGLLYGDSPEDGYVRGQRFIHAMERYQFDVPQGFQLANTQTAIWALGPDKSLVKFDGDEKTADMGVATYVRNVWATQFDIADLQEFDLNGMQAAMARTRLQGLETRIVAIAFSPTKVYRFLIGTAPQSGTVYDKMIGDMLASFRRLSDEEAVRVGPWRVRTVSFPEGTPLVEVAARMAPDTHRLAQFRLLNGFGDEESLNDGARFVDPLVKIIVEDVAPVAP